MATTNTVLKKHIKAGMSLLDARNPGWRNKIDLAMLDLASGFRCVLGQLYGSYSNGVDRLQLADDEVDEYGFLVGARIWEGTREEFGRLTLLWKDALGGPKTSCADVSEQELQGEQSC